ncbi:MAG: arginine N-succinyltransferase, partial [Myxococcota bacterium]
GRREAGPAVLMLRPVAADDLDALVTLARELDSVNLPADADFLRRRIERSLKSFRGKLEDRREGVYVFVLEDLATARCIGTSMILAKTGTPEAPYYWLEVSTEERRSNELDRRFLHTKLRLRSTDDGPTEVGGLILDPAYRRHPSRCGKALSVVRFAYISMHPRLFERYVIAEMLSRFEAPGTNLMWDAFGARFTGLSYREADRLSARTKQFIADLFPRDPVYATLFPGEVQEVIGRPNDTARAAVRILEKVGFHALNQVDPFDGGPYYGAARDAITTVRERRELVLPGQPREELAESEPLALLSAEGRFGFRATVVSLDAEGTPIVSAHLREALGVGSGDRVSVTPLP